MPCIYKKADIYAEADKISSVWVIRQGTGNNAETEIRTPDDISAFCTAAEHMRGIKFSSYKTYKADDTPVIFSVYESESQLKSRIVCYDKFMEVYPYGHEETAHYVYLLPSDPLKEYGEAALDKAGISEVFGLTNSGA